MADKDIEEVVDSYSESDEIDVVEDMSTTADLDIEKGKIKPQHAQQNALKVRRDIEDYFEKKRLRNELDYLLDDNENKKITE